MSPFVLVIIVLVCLMLEGFFSGSELAIVTADPAMLKLKADKGEKGAECSLKFFERPQLLFSVTLVGTNAAVVTASSAATYFLIKNYGVEYAPFAILLSPLVLVFGEILPKSICQAKANNVAPVVAPIIWSIFRIIYPIVFPFIKLTNAMLGDIAKRWTSKHISREELASIISEETYGLDVTMKERKMLGRVFELADAEAKNIMVPLINVQVIDVSSKVSDAMALFDKGYSRLPVSEGRTDNIIGMLAFEDVLFAEENREIREFIKGVSYVPEVMPIYELYEVMQEKGEDVAIVVDEYGGAEGIVTLEDLLEEIVGEIRDEYELGEQHYKQISSGRYFISGKMEVEKVRAELGIEIPPGDYETLAGYMLSLFGRIPLVGERIEDEHAIYTIRRASTRVVIEIEAIKKVPNET